ncbi:hypothetical protein ACNKHR_05735 [Shigella flexneri]
MFKSFFPKPGAFFSRPLLGIDCRYLWQAGGGDWVARITALRADPISAARFWSLDFLIFTLTTLFASGLLHFSGLSTARTVGNTRQYSVLH